jgi:hypothetical protein
MPPVQNCSYIRERESGRERGWERERSTGVANGIMSFAICSLDLKEMELVTSRKNVPGFKQKESSYFFK